MEEILKTTEIFIYANDIFTYTFQQSSFKHNIGNSKHNAQFNRKIKYNILLSLKNLEKGCNIGLTMTLQ